MNKKFKYDGKSRPADNTYRENYDSIFNPTLTKNMKHVKWSQIPPVRGPDPQGLKKK